MYLFNGLFNFIAGTEVFERSVSVGHHYEEQQAIGINVHLRREERREEGGRRGGREGWREGRRVEGRISLFVSLLLAIFLPFHCKLSSI